MSRTLSPQPPRGGSPIRQFPDPDRMPDGLRPVAVDVQSGASPRSALYRRRRNGGPLQPLRTRRASLSLQASTGKLSGCRARSDRQRRGADLVRRRQVLHRTGDKFYVGEAFDGDPVAVRPVAVRPREPQQNEAGETVCEDEASRQKWAVYYCQKKVHVIESDPPNQ